MAEDNVINVTDVASKGVVFDTPPISLSPNIFTDVRNVRFKDGAIRKIEGELLLNNITSDLTGSGQAFGKVRYLAVWENPNLQPTGCYYIFVVDYVLNNVTVGQKVYVQDHLGTKRDITPTTLNSGNGFGYTVSGWQHTLFTGGFAFIINNGIDKPHYILDAAGNTAIANLVLAELPGWDSYNVDQPVISDVWNTGEREVFDIGQRVDFSLNSIIVTVAGASRAAEAGTPAGSNTSNAANFVPGVYPGYASLPTVTSSKFQIYTDANTNTTVVMLAD